jgi:uncharacterized protein (TIGR00369 family)
MNKDGATAHVLSKERADFLLRDFGRGFVKFCGFEGIAADPGRFESRVQIESRHRQQDGFIHAGVMATMADHTAGYAAFTLVSQDHRILTVEFKINFLRPASGECLICRATVIKDGSRIIIAESEVCDLHGRQESVVAKALVTLTAVPVNRIVSKD